MNKKLIRLAERRERLVTRAAEQRVALAQNIEPYRMPLALADRGIYALRYIKSHPEWLVGVVVLPCGTAAWPRREMAGAWLGTVADDVYTARQVRNLDTPVAN
jgi:YqjK-like protein